MTNITENGFIWRELSLPASKLAGYNRLIGNIESLVVKKETIESYTLLIPLQFWFCRHYGLAIPLIAMEHSDIKINITLEKLSKLVLVNNNFTSGAEQFIVDSKDECLSGISLCGALQPKLWVNYVFLDNLERQYFASKPHCYLIDQLQFNGDLSLTCSKSNKKTSNEFKQNFPINFTHPVKEIIWVTKTQGHLPGNYTNQNVSSILDYVNNKLTNDAKNPNIKAQLVISGQDRFRLRTGTNSDNFSSLFFDSLQVLEHHTHTPARGGVNVYNFGLYPENDQPSGSLNFSRVENPSLNLTYFKSDQTRSVCIFGLNYNQLRVTSGTAGLAWNS